MTAKQFKDSLCQLLSLSNNQNNEELVNDVENLVNTFNTGIEFETTLNK